jgi:hypothetical protein
MISTMAMDIAVTVAVVDMVAAVTSTLRKVIRQR